MTTKVVEIKIPKKAIQFSVNGESVVIDLPTVKQTKEFREKLVEANNNDMSTSLVLENYLINLGLREEVLIEMQEEQILEVANILTGQKKI